MRLYLEHGDSGRAGAHVDVALGSLPQDAAAQAVYAGFLEELRRPADALLAWRRTVALDPSNERGALFHGPLSREEDWTDALRAAEAGIGAAPNSARLHLAHATILERENRIYDARRAREDASSIQDLDFLRYGARLEDAYGGNAPQAYRRLAEGLQRTGAPDLAATLQRGLIVSLREADDQQASWFAGTLHQEPATVARKESIPGVWIPGGFGALAFIARGKANSSSEEFLTDYARAIAVNGGTPSHPIQAYLRPLCEYFDQLGALLQMASAKEHQAVITLSLADKPSRQKTQRILDILAGN